MKIHTKKDIAIVYIVAGMSSRFAGEIKQFAEVGVNGESLIECSLKQALSAGFSKIIFVVGEKTEKGFKEKFGSEYNGIPIHYAFQHYDKSLRDKPWGTLDALCSAREIIDCPFVVCNGDDLYGKRAFEILVNHLREEEHGASIGYKLIDNLPEEGCANRAIINCDGEDNICDIKEFLGISKNRLSEKGLNEDHLCSMNIFAFPHFILEHLNNAIDEFKLLNQGDRIAECLLPNEISKLISNGILKLKGYPVSEKTIGITFPEDKEKVRKMILERGL
ncbi:hypothetical protein HOD75_01735 [archaeon]|jgi:choline kinase|nr:hypothetical protein [archaeon]MBT4241598.1 hypothetical protein [archaeon]MBT4417993.1 hypothetical protein [archaeon]